MKKNSKEEVRDTIGEILKKHPNISIDDFCEGFSDFLAHSSLKSPHLFSHFCESFLKWAVYHTLSRENESD